MTCTKVSRKKLPHKGIPQYVGPWRAHARSANLWHARNSPETTWPWSQNSFTLDSWPNFGFIHCRSGHVLYVAHENIDTTGGLRFQEIAFGALSARINVRVNSSFSIWWGTQPCDSTPYPFYPKFLFPYVMFGRMGGFGVFFLLQWEQCLKPN